MRNIFLEHTSRDDLDFEENAIALLAAHRRLRSKNQYERDVLTQHKMNETRPIRYTRDFSAPRPPTHIRERKSGS